ncbi:tetratricopeptide repeat-containing serine protease family protein [Geothrix sp. 21YS21S-4]|uniref:tetratricopeptide repeat-containing S1 family peptidase n=1 Tax=Geothrix sp. 21YS21S-4 TaxID=3068889 RepID=UPI0027BAF2F2|nr:tetratricopeptide repeat-containing serine protease family protein [Geothrix sp. 21YS21S-4]
MILPGPLPAVQEPPAIQAVTSQAACQASVVLVHSRLGGARVHQGSGVVVAPELVATNAHVVVGGGGITVHHNGGAWPATPVRLDPSLDLCLLAVPGLTAPPAVSAPDPEEPGQAVVAVGYPGGRATVTAGHLRGIWHYGKSLLLQSDAPTHPGSSGGGLFDLEGRLLGLTTLTFTTSPRLNFSVPWTSIDALQTTGEGARLEPGPALAVDLMERLATDPRNTPLWEAAARQWVSDRPDDAQAWLALGLALDQAVRGDGEKGASSTVSILKEAVAAYRRSLALHSEARAWNNLGGALDLLDRTDEAERAYGEALALAPRYALAWFNLGGTRLNARRFSEAAIALKEGLALRPDEGEAWGRLATCQRLQGQRETAVATYETALRYRPLAADLWLEFGMLLVELGRGNRIAEIRARLADLDPEAEVRLKGAWQRSLRAPGGTASAKRGR